jgi:hypothetical protein
MKHMKDPVSSSLTRQARRWWGAGRPAQTIQARLLVSAASFALFAAAWPIAAQAATTEISESTSTALTTSESGDILIDSNGAVAIQKASTAALTINSSNYLLNNGSISNTAVDGAQGVLIDTSAGNITSYTTGFASTGTIDISGSGTGKYGVLIQGGHTFYGPITLTGLTSSSTSSTQSSSIVVKGDTSIGFELASGTTVTSNILFGGGGIVQNASTTGASAGGTIIDLEGVVNGNVQINSALSGVGGGLTGLKIGGGINSCASDISAPSGFTCPTSSAGALVVSGSISLAGIATASSKGNNPEAGTAVAIGASIDGGFLIYGPGTSSSVTSSTLSSSGITSSSSTTPTLYIAPSSGPVVLGPVAAVLDTINPGYSVSNRGNIYAQPTDSGLSTTAIVIQGASSAYYTCLSAAVDVCSTTSTSVTAAVTDSAGAITNVTYQRGGGFLNTGTVLASTTTTIDTSSPTATAFYIGPYATVPRLDVLSEAVSTSSNTAGSISAQVSGNGEGTAYGVVIATNANVPEISVSKNAQISATVSTTTTSPTTSIASSTAPFTLQSWAILDRSNTLATINNGGTIQAQNTTLSPQSGAVIATVERAIDLSASSIGNIQINNSGRILGDILFGETGNGDILNVGNISSAGNAATGVLNTSNNYAIVAGRVVSESSGSAPSTQAGTINFGGGSDQILHVGSFGYVNAVINAASAGELTIQVEKDGLLYVANTTSSVQASTVVIAPNGTLGLSISQQNLNTTTPVIQASNSATLSGANIGLAFGTYIAATDPSAPTAQTITLLQAPVITDTTLATQNVLLGQNTPFLFESPASANVVAGDKGPTPLTIGSQSGQQTLLLHLLPRSVNATNADGSPGLNLSGDAKNQFPFVTAALSTDNELGAAIASSLTVYKTPGLASSGINVAASQQQAQQVFSQFAPDVSGGTREIAIMLTDQATGPVASRQRLLRGYGNTPGDMTLWGEEFAGHINNKGRPSGSGDLVSYKDHGVGFALGVDAGSPRNGWYGGAFTFYSGDVSQLLPRATRTQTEWYMLTGYTDWKGKRFFLDTQVSAAYGSFHETRSISVGGISRYAESKRPAAMLALGANAGLITHILGGVELDPHLSLDGLTLREEGYTESGGGSGFNLAVAPYFANSLRAALGTDIKTQFTVFGLDFIPEARLGYRYDLLHQPVKIRAGFDSTGGLGTAGNTMQYIGPDPDTGNAIAGLSFGAGTDTWRLGVNYDWVRGNNGSTTQVGTLTILGRI